MSNQLVKTYQEHNYWLANKAILKELVSLWLVKPSLHVVLQSTQNALYLLLPSLGKHTGKDTEMETWVDYQVPVGKVARVHYLQPYVSL